MTFLTMWQIMAPSFNQTGSMGALLRRTVTGRDNRPIQNLETFDWLSEFRISLGMVAFTPQAIGQTRGALRSRMIQMLRTSRLGSQVQQYLVSPTVALTREHDAYIEEPGILAGVTPGERDRIADHPPPVGSSPVGYVHTHPPSPQIRPPTPGSDWLDSGRYPVQLMVESGPGRVWGLISPNFAFPIGLMSRTGIVSELNPSSPQAVIVYALRGA